MKDLVPIDPSNRDEKNDALTRILQFYEPNSEVVLTADEDKIHTRWLHCDALIRSRKHKTHEIIQMMVDKFSVSKFTAERDIAQTYALFGQVRVMSKQYVITHAIENLQIRIQQFETDKSLVHLVPKMYQELARFSAMLPDEVAKKKVEVPNVYIGSLTINNNNADNGTNAITAKEAEDKFRAIKKDLLADDDYIESEDIPE